jgi:hypothetical protein
MKTLSWAEGQENDVSNQKAVKGELDQLLIILVKQSTPVLKSLNQELSVGDAKDILPNPFFAVRLSWTTKGHQSSITIGALSQEQ